MTIDQDLVTAFCVAVVIFAIGFPFAKDFFNKKMFEEE